MNKIVREVMDETVEEYLTQSYYYIIYPSPLKPALTQKTLRLRKHYSNKGGFIKTWGGVMKMLLSLTTPLYQTGTLATYVLRQGVQKLYYGGGGRAKFGILDDFKSYLKPGEYEHLKDIHFGKGKMKSRPFLSYPIDNKKHEIKSATETAFVNIVKSIGAVRNI